MSDYYGKPKLEDWLKEEVFPNLEVTEEIVKLFEKWRSDIEADISSWMETDDGEGNNLSWRGWGRGFNSISTEDMVEFDELVKQVVEKEIIRYKSINS